MNYHFKESYVHIFLFNLHLKSALRTASLYSDISVKYKPPSEKKGTKAVALLWKEICRWKLMYEINLCFSNSCLWFFYSCLTCSIQMTGRSVLHIDSFVSGNSATVHPPLGRMCFPQICVEDSGEYALWEEGLVSLLCTLFFSVTN